MTVIINGTTGIDTVQDGIVTDAKLNLTANSQEIKDALNATGSAPIYACRAWVNFNGTGTVAIRASGNVSSITDNGTGDYTINFTTAMPDANYAIVLPGRENNSLAGGIGSDAETSSACNVVFRRGSDGLNFDNDKCSVAIFR
jgi:hypothetical protein